MQRLLALKKHPLPSPEHNFKADQKKHFDFKIKEQVKKDSPQEEKSIYFNKPEETTKVPDEPVDK